MIDDSLKNKEIKKNKKYLRGKAATNPRCRFSIFSVTFVMNPSSSESDTDPLRLMV